MKKTKDVLNRKGCYTLVFSFKKKNWIRVGKLGRICFPRGTYLYTGSAMKNLASRISRHLATAKKLHWHIDYLLSCSEVRLREVFLYPGTTRLECKKNRELLKRPGAKVIVRRLGASDCTAGCPSHLVFLARQRVTTPVGADVFRVTSDRMLQHIKRDGQKQ